MRKTQLQPSLAFYNGTTVCQAGRIQWGANRDKFQRLLWKKRKVSCVEEKTASSCQHDSVYSLTLRHATEVYLKLTWRYKSPETLRNLTTCIVKWQKLANHWGMSGSACLSHPVWPAWPRARSISPHMCLGSPSCRVSVCLSPLLTFSPTLEPHTHVSGRVSPQWVRE